MKNDDFIFAEKKLDSVSGALPEALSPENVTKLVQKQQAQKTEQKTANKRRYLPAVISTAAALLILIGVGVGVKTLKNSPAAQKPGVTAENGTEVGRLTPSPAAKGSYAAIGRLLGQKRQSEDYAEGYAYDYAMNGAVRNGAKAFDDDAAAPAQSASPSAKPATQTETGEADYTRLNTRTEGVDEADIIRTDGNRIYVLGTSSASVYGPYHWFYMNTERVKGAQTFTVVDPNGGDMLTDSKISLSLIEEDDTEATRERYFDGFFLYGNYAVFTGNEYTIVSGSLKRGEEDIPGAWQYDGGSYYDYGYAVPNSTVDAEPAPADPAYAYDTPVQDDPDAPVYIRPSEDEYTGSDYATVDPLPGEDGYGEDPNAGQSVPVAPDHPMTAPGVPEDDIYEVPAVSDHAYAQPLRMESAGLIMILDISDPENPKEVKTLRYDSELIGVRIAGDKLIAVSAYYPLRTYGFNADDYKTYIPCVGEDLAPEDSIVIADEEGEAFFTVAAVDLSDPALGGQSVTVLGNACELYCAADTVYAYGSTYDYDRETGTSVDALQLYSVDISGSAPVFTACAALENVWLRDDYAIDEYNGTLRLALEYWDEADVQNYILILDRELKELGRTESFGEDESIQSVRFSGDQAYVVTFRNTDPFFVIDLSDPKAPVIRGELKLPGYSAYLHPIAEGFMLGVGEDGDEEGLTDGGKISLFSVSDPENPVETDRIVLTNGWFDTDRKSYTVYGENGCIVVYHRWVDFGTRNSYTVCGALVLKAENGKLTELGRFEAGRGSSTPRALFIGNTLYLYTPACWQVSEDGRHAMTEDAIYSFDLASGNEISKLSLRTELIDWS